MKKKERKNTHKLKSKKKITNFGRKENYRKG